MIALGVLLPIVAVLFPNLAVYGVSGSSAS